MIQQPKLFFTLLAALLSISAVQARTFNTFSNKNVLMHRSQHSNAAMEYSTWHSHLYGQGNGHMHSRLQIAPFYQASERAKDLGKYFGVGNGTDTFKLGDAQDLDSKLVIHRSTGAPYAAADVKLAPEQEQYGARFDFFQDLNSPIKNLFVRASTTAVHVQNNMHVTFSGVTQAGGSLTIADFFSGAGSNLTEAANKQAALTKARMAGRRSAMGLADIDFSLGHKCLQTERSHAFFSVDMTIPVGNRVQADYAFAPTYGNGRHFGLGASFDGGVKVWSNDVGSLRFNSVVRYKYLFENTEERTMSLKTGAHGTTGLQNNMSKYFLVGQVGLAGALQPLANISSVGVSVKPGHQLDMLAAMSFSASKFTIDLGYNPFWRDAENVHVNSFAADGKYKIVAPGFDASSTVASGDELKLADFDLASITTPTLLTHKLFGGVGYSWDAYGSTHMSVGLGGSYEFATSNADIEQYAVWGKFNVSF